MTIIEADFAALLSADAEAPKPLHYVCRHCWPDSTPAGVPIAVCGYQTTGAPEDGFNGRHACAVCLALNNRSPLPCGHP
jgi:hypothetical protein